MDTTPEYIDVQFLRMLNAARYQQGADFMEFDITKDRQDQLQKMVAGTHLEKLGRVYRSVEKMELFPSDSMEQLWLSFVMKERHRTWDGETWK